VWSEVRVPKGRGTVPQARAAMPPVQVPYGQPQPGSTHPGSTQPGTARPGPSGTAPQGIRLPDGAMSEHEAAAAAASGRGQFFDSKRLERKPPRGRGGRAARLVVLEPRPLRGRMLAIAGEMTIGRAERCTLSVPDDTFASQLHARVYHHEGQPMIEDLGSTNGTFHNGNKIVGSRLIHPGDRIQIGTTVIEAQ
jgi:hypothetical protein